MSLDHFALQRADHRVAAVLGIVAVVAHHEVMSFRYGERTEVRFVRRHFKILLDMLAVYIQLAAAQLDGFSRQTDYALDAVHAVVRVRIIADDDIESLRIAQQIVKLRRNHELVVFQRVQHRRTVHPNRLKDERAHDECQCRRHHEHHDPFKDFSLQALLWLLLFFCRLFFLLHGCALVSFLFSACPPLSPFRLFRESALSRAQALFSFSW